MAEIALSSVQTVLDALTFFEVKQIRSFLGYKSQIKDLRRTATTIKNILKDAESSKEFTNKLHLQGYIQQLQDVIYEADDLIDEFVTQVELGKLSESDAFFAKVSSLFSITGLQICYKAQNIKKQLNDIAFDQRYSIVVDKYDNKPICSRGDETCSDINSKYNIIGRDADKKAILDKLFESNNQNVRFLTIVGVGGLGKTALAQLVFNDEKLKQEFGKEMFWVCVSDQFVVKTILLKILELVMGQKPSFDDSSSMELIKQKFEDKLGGKKYLIVLDDVWNEDREKWLVLENFLMLGQGGSKVLVTTRSEITARVIGDEQPYMLKKLSPEDSWHLFETVAFGKDKNKQQPSEEMVEIGEKIVDKCSNIPLAIKVVGSLLYGQDIRTWDSFENTGLAEIGNGDNKIMSVLKLSYDNLGSSSLKSCFSYCALFPKDFEIKKGLLIKLWMAQGYIEPFNENQSIEDAAEQHFNILLRRCFFQDLKKDKYDEIKSVKIHDLMHDVAQEVGGGEAKVLSLHENSLGDRIRHLNILDEECFESSSTWTNHLRTLIIEFCDSDKLNVNDILGKRKILRVLTLKYLDGGITHNSFSELQHLRYLDLSSGDFRKLPQSTTELHNLQTLILNGCFYLKELPNDFSKLVKLTHLDLHLCAKLKQLPHDFSKLEKLTHLNLAYCGELKQLPHDFGKLEKLIHLNLANCKKLTELPHDLGKLEKLIHLNLANYYKLTELPHDFGKLEKLIHLNLANCYKLTELPHDFRKLVKLSHLILDGCKELTGMPLGLDRLKKIGALTSLVGRIDIEVGESCNNVEVMKELSGEYLSKIPGLKEVNIYMKFDDAQAAEAALEKLEPHPNLKELSIGSYGGRTIPWWRSSAKDELAPLIQLSNLVSIQINNCGNLVNLPSFSKLPFLNSLSVGRLNNLEYMETRSSSPGANDTTFFPSLLNLRIRGCSKLKGWFREEGLGDADCGCWGTLSFPRLSTLEIRGCPNMTSFPPCPTVESISFVEGKNTRQLLEKMMGKVGEDQREVTIGSQTSTSSSSSSSRLATLEITDYFEVESLSEYEKVFQMCASSLKSLEIRGCYNLSRFSRGLEHLTALEWLQIRDMAKLDFSEDINEDIMAWEPLQHTLHSLTFHWLPNMKSLPEGMKHLTSLQTLKLEHCRELKGIPECISCLSSLQSLTIESCNAIKSLPQGIQTLSSLKTLKIENYYSQLIERCREDDGEDWPKIKHIPNRHIRKR